MEHYVLTGYPVQRPDDWLLLGLLVRLRAHTVHVLLLLDVHACAGAAADWIHADKVRWGRSRGAGRYVQGAGAASADAGRRGSGAEAEVGDGTERLGRGAEGGREDRRRANKDKRGARMGEAVHVPPAPAQIGLLPCWDEHLQPIARSTSHLRSARVPERTASLVRWEQLRWGPITPPLARCSRSALPILRRNSNLPPAPSGQSPPPCVLGQGQRTRFRRRNRASSRSPP